METLVAGKDYKLNLPGKYLSYSQISLYLKCPRLYWYKYCAKIDSAPNAYMVQGSIMHELIETSFQKWMQSKKHLTFKQAQKLVKGLWEQKMPEVGHWGWETPDRVGARLVDFLHLLFEQGQIKQWKPKEIEKEYKVKVAGVPVLGYTDLIEKDCITDFKTTTAPSRYPAGSSLQLMLHSLAHKIPKAWFAFFSGKTKGKQAAVVNPDPVTFDLEEVKQWVEFQVSTVAKGISDGNFFPRGPDVNTYCSESCDAWEQCFGGTNLCTTETA